MICSTSADTFSPAIWARDLTYVELGRIDDGELGDW